MDTRLKSISEMPFAEARERLKLELHALETVAGGALWSHIMALPSSDKDGTFTISDARLADGIKILTHMSAQTYEDKFELYQQYSTRVKRLRITASTDYDTYNKIFHDVNELVSQASCPLIGLNLTLDAPGLSNYPCSLPLLLGRHTNIVELKLSSAESYTFTGLEAPRLKHLELVSSVLHAKERITLCHTHRSSAGHSWKTFANFLSRLDALETVSLQGVLPPAKQGHIYKGIVCAVPDKLSKLDLYDELGACDFFCWILRNSEPAPAISDLTLRIALFESNAASASIFWRLLFVNRRELLRAKSLGLRDLDIGWSGVRPASLTQDITVAMAYTDTEDPDSQDGPPARCDSQARYILETDGPSNAWFGPVFAKQQMPLAFLRSLAFGGPGDPCADMGFSKDRITDALIIGAPKIQELTLRGSHSCLLMCEALLEQTRRALDTMYATQGPLTSGEVGRAPRSAHIALDRSPYPYPRLKELVLVDVDFIKTRRPTPARHSAGQDKVVGNVADILHELLFVRRAGPLADQSQWVHITIRGSATRISHPLLEKLHGVGGPDGVDIAKDVSVRDEVAVWLQSQGLFKRVVPD